jgi:hypothetical protein
MFRQVEVAGELYVPSEPRRSPAWAHAARPTTPTPRALPYTGLHMAVGHPPTVIVSDLLSHMLPADLDAPVMLLGPTGDYPTITLSDADVEEVRDLDPREAEQPPTRYDSGAHEVPLALA